MRSSYSKVMLVALMIFGLCYSLSLAQTEVEIGSDVGQKAPDFKLEILDGGWFHLYEELGNYNATLLVFFLAAT